MKSSSKFRNLICNSTSRGCLAPALGIALLLLLLPASIHAQAVSRINGTVTDQAGRQSCWYEIRQIIQTRRGPAELGIALVAIPYHAVQRVDRLVGCHSNGTA